MASNILDTVSLTIKLASIINGFKVLKNNVFKKKINVQKDPLYGLAFYKMKKKFVFKGKCARDTPNMKCCRILILNMGKILVVLPLLQVYREFLEIQFTWGM